jgi:hypothetical protein
MPCRETVPGVRHSPSRGTQTGHRRAVRHRVARDASIFSSRMACARKHRERRGSRGAHSERLHAAESRCSIGSAPRKVGPSRPDSGDGHAALCLSYRSSCGERRPRGNPRRVRVRGRVLGCCDPVAVTSRCRSGTIGTSFGCFLDDCRSLPGLEFCLQILTHHPLTQKHYRVPCGFWSAQAGEGILRHLRGFSR